LWTGILQRTGGPQLEANVQQKKSGTAIASHTECTLLHTGTNVIENTIAMAKGRKDLHSAK
jgi:hypothetical protein